MPQSKPETSSPQRPQPVSAEPVHNGTFELGLHAWQEPFNRIAELAGQRGVPLATPEMGQALNLIQPEAGRQWWKDVDR